MNNLELWNAVEATDGNYTKETSNGRYTFTCIDPQYQLLQATKQWGPYGRRWGMRNLNWTTIPNDIKPIMMLTCEFFYPLPRDDGREETVSFPISVDMSLKPGDDICKKLMTSARSKALSYLGFSADVFLGKFEDDAYVKENKLRFGEQQKFIEQALGKIRASKTGDELDECQGKVHMLLGKSTITTDVADMLNGEIAQKRATIND